MAIKCRRCRSPVSQPLISQLTNTVLSCRVRHPLYIPRADLFWSAVFLKGGCLLDLGSTPRKSCVNSCPEWGRFGVNRSTRHPSLSPQPLHAISICPLDPLMGQHRPSTNEASRVCIFDAAPTPAVCQPLVALVSPPDTLFSLRTLA